MRLRLNGNRQHLFSHRHFQIHTRIQRLAQNAYITVGNMATILAQVYGYTIRPRLLGDKRRLYRVGVSSTTRIT